MELVRFANQKGARAIRADDLDGNFARLQPISNDGPARTYAINATPNGWTLTLYPEIMREIFPELPTNAGEDIYLLASVNNGYIWVRLADILPSEPPESGDYVLTAQNGTQVWVALSEFFDDVLDDPQVREQLDAIIEQAIADYLEANLDGLIEDYLESRTPAQFNSILSAIYGETFALRTVERCDGQRMKLLATDWYTP
jgi:hypothetical protein